MNKEKTKLTLCTVWQMPGPACILV